LTSCILWPSLPLGEGNLNLSVFSSTTDLRALLFSPFGGVTTVSSSPWENGDGGCWSEVRSWAEWSIFVRWRRYKTYTRFT
jgi:hypothetical protein